MQEDQYRIGARDTAKPYALVQIANGHSFHRRDAVRNDPALGVRKSSGMPPTQQNDRKGHEHAP